MKGDKLDKNIIKDKYIACMVLHAVGDTVGFKNGEWEFKRGGVERTLEKLYEFIDLGGINHISLENWNVSDDTIMHMKTAESILSNYNSINSLGKILKDNFLVAYNSFFNEGLEKRMPGKSTLDSIKILDNIPYDFYSGGSGASMRSLCIGLALYGENNRDKLIQIAIESGRMTNNSASGYLGALASALFTALAIEGVKINDWPFILLELFDSGKITKYIKSSGRDIKEYDRDHHVFIDKWHRYVEDKFDDDRKPIIRKSNRNLVYRTNYYFETFGFNMPSDKPDSEYVNVKTMFIGSGGDDSVIIAYDCLIDSGMNWEKLVIYAMLHMGDTDTTGAIAAGLYGALYGMKNIPENFIANLEFKKEITELGIKLFNKFYK
jgi:ADP-ribosylarginine hydrolase